MNIYIFRKRVNFLNENFTYYLLWIHLSKRSVVCDMVLRGEVLVYERAYVEMERVKKETTPELYIFSGRARDAK